MMRQFRGRVATTTVFVGLAAIGVAVLISAQVGADDGAVPSATVLESEADADREDTAMNVSEKRMVEALQTPASRSTLTARSGANVFAVDVWIDSTAEPLLYCFRYEVAATGGCRTDGEPLSGGTLPVLLTPDRAGVLLLFERDVASATAVAFPSGLETPLELTDVGLTSGRSLAAVVWPAEAATVEVTTFNAQGVVLGVRSAE